MQPECTCGATDWIIKDINITGVTEDGRIGYDSAHFECNACGEPYMNLRK